MKSGGAIKNRPISELIDFDDEESVGGYPASRDFHDHDDFRASLSAVTPDEETFQTEGEEPPHRVFLSHPAQQVGLWRRWQCIIPMSIALIVSVVVTSVELTRMGPGLNTLYDSSDATEQLRLDRLKSLSTGTLTQC